MFELTILAISVITTTVIGLAVLQKDVKSITGRSFALLSFFLSGWAALTYLSLHATVNQLIFIRLVMFSVVVMNTAFFYLVQVFPTREFDFKLTHKIGFIYSLIVAIIALSPWLFIGISIGQNGSVSPSPGPGIILFLIHAIIFAIGGVIYLLIRYSRSRGKEKAQLGFMMLGTIAFLILTPLTNFILPVIFHQSSLVILSPVNNVLFSTFTGYAIFKHRLFDIRFVVARSVAFTLLIAILAALYASGVFAFSWVFFAGKVDNKHVVVYAGMALFIALTFQPLKSFIERITERVFYKIQYNANDLLTELTRMMASTLKLEPLTDQTLKKLCQSMHITWGVFYAVGDHQDLQVSALQGQAQPQTPSKFQLSFLQTFKKLTIFEEEPEGETKKFLRELDISVALPLYANKELQGILVLGEKQSGDIYDDHDIQLLEILGPELAVAVDNARSYKQISEFNQTLKQEINKATSELRQVNEQLHQKNQQLEQLDKLKDEFISVTSHELRTPLTAIRGYLWMAMHGRRRDQNYRLYMDRAYQSSERLIDLVNDTLDISRIESGRVELEPAPADLISLTDEVIAELGSRAAERQQHLSATHTNLPPVHCDANKIRQVLTNLIGNALKFTPKQGTIEVTFARQNNMVVTKVYDSGPSLTPEEQSKLFQKFSRLETTLATTPGTGLGLYLCKQIVELSGGKIWIESQAGQGTSFLFSLPIEKDLGSTTAIPASPALPPAPAGANP